LQHDDLLDHAKLQERIDTPICLDESIVSVKSAEHAIELGSCRYVNVKPGRVGGLTVAKSVHDLCRDAGIGCWVGGMLESGVGAAICLALATLENFTYPADIFPASRFYAEDLAEPAVSFETSSDGGWYAVAGDEPGIAPAPKPDLLEQLTADRFVIEA
ncbi:MAG: o-succinylbenzoate synthase, partial [Acidimicrobiaceae bacterium]|nr:o-succinylbenzoate synthase [Acidimicrobiaceae bacterium]